VDPVLFAVALLVAWVLVAGGLALGLGRVVAVARVREEHGTPDSPRRRPLLRRGATPAGGTSSVRSS